MEGPNILLARIDNRLVHGQVGVIWLTSVGANLLVVVDDQAANDKLQQQLMSMVVESSGSGIRFFTVKHTIDIIHKANPSQKMFIICKTPEVIRQLVDGGVPIKDVNVGNMHFMKGKHQISKKVYVDEKDLKDLHYIKSKGINVFIQDVPGDTIEYID